MKTELLEAELTPYWKRFASEAPGAHGCMKALAEVAYETGADEVAASKVEADGFEAARREGGIEQREGDQVAFASEEVRDDYLVRHAVSLLSREESGDASAFAEAFAEVTRHVGRVVGVGSEIRPMVLLMLAEEHGYDLLALLSELGEQAVADEKESRSGRSAFWDLYGPVTDVLPRLDIKPSRLANKAAAIQKASAGDLVGGKLGVAVRYMAREKTGRANALYEAFIAESDPASVALTADVLIGLSVLDLKEAHSRALQLTEEGRAVRRRVGIVALSRLEYTPTHATQLRQSWQRLQELQDEEDESIDDTLARAYGNLLEAADRGEGGTPEPREVGAALVEMANRPSARTRHAVTEALFRSSENHAGEKWCEKALLRLAGERSTQGGTVRNLDYCASRYLEINPPNPEKAFRFVRAFVLQRPDEGEAHELLSATFSRLLENHFDDLQAELTRWLASCEPRLHVEASDVYQRYGKTDLGEDSARRFAFSKSVLDDLEEQEVVHAVQRFCGYVAGGGELLAELVLSVHRRESVSKGLSQFIVDMLQAYVLYNYPQGGRKELQRCVEDSGESDEVRHAAQEALERSEEYYDALRTLPDLKEFDPPSSRIYQLRRAQHKQQSEMKERAHQQSAFLSLVTRLPLKYGRSFFSEQPAGSFSAPSGLDSFSQSYERPRGELIDPVGQAYQRLLWRQVGLKEGAEEETPEPNSNGEAEA